MSVYVCVCVFVCVCVYKCVCVSVCVCVLYFPSILFSSIICSRAHSIAGYQDTGIERRVESLHQH